MDDPWTSCRPFSSHSWLYHPVDHNYHLYMRNNDSFDQSGGSSNPSRDDFSCPDDTFGHIAPASMPAHEEESGHASVPNSPVWKRSTKRRVDDVDPFFQPLAGHDLYSLEALSPRTGNKMTHDDHGTEPGKAGFRGPEEGFALSRHPVDLNEEVMPYSMHAQQDEAQSYPDYRPNWRREHSSDAICSPSLRYYPEPSHYLTPRHDSYPSVQLNPSFRPPMTGNVHRTRRDYSDDLGATESSPPNQFDGSRDSGRSKRSRGSTRLGQSNAANEKHRTAPKLAPSAAALESSGTPRLKEALLAWYDRLNELHTFKQQHGHTNVPQKYAENPKLGVWVNKQRMEKKGYDDNAQSSLTREKLEALASIGFVWAKRKGQHSWDTKYAELSEYKRIHGDCLVPTKYAENSALGRWVSSQRSQYKAYVNEEKSTMTQSKIDKLNRLGFVWSMLP